jgi:hypothetical protein
MSGIKNSRRYSQVKVHHRGINDTSGTGGKIYRRCRGYRGYFATGVVDNGSKFYASIVNNGGAP